MKINGKTILSTSSTTTNYVLKQSSTAGTLINSLIYDDGSNIALGTTTPLTGGGASKWITLNGSTYGGGIISSALGVAKGYLYYDNASETFALQGASGVGATIWTNSAERMRITSSGNVGIGTSSPTGNAGASRIFQVEGSFDTEIQSKGSGAWVRANSTNSFQGGFGGFQYFQNGVENFGMISAGAGTNTMLLTTGGTERMRITSSGNVGIGTTSPIHQLSVANKIGGILFGDSFLEFPSSGNTILKANNDVIIGYSQNTVITQNGSVGIGTTTPDASALLDVSSTTQGFLPPRMTTSERDAISSPASGLMIWNTDNRQIEVFSVSVWVGLAIV